MINVGTVEQLLPGTVRLVITRQLPRRASRSVLLTPCAHEFVPPASTSAYASSCGSAFLSVCSVPAACRAHRVSHIRPLAVAAERAARHQTCAVATLLCGALCLLVALSVTQRASCTRYEHADRGQVRYLFRGQRQVQRGYGCCPLFLFETALRCTQPYPVNSQFYQRFLGRPIFDTIIKSLPPGKSRVSVAAVSELDRLQKNSRTRRLLNIELACHPTRRAAFHLPPHVSRRHRRRWQILQRAGAVLQLTHGPLRDSLLSLTCGPHAFCWQPHRTDPNLTAAGPELTRVRTCAADVHWGGPEQAGC